MQGISAATEQGNTVQQGTNGQNEQSSELNQSVGEPQDNLSPQEKPAGEDSSGTQEPVKDAAYWESQYKELQTDYTKRNESEKGWKEKFQAFGGVDKVHEHLSFLVNDPAFHDYLKKRQSQEYVGGQDISQMDDEQRQAVELVQKIVDQTVASRLDSFKKENFDPLATSYHKDSITNVLGQIESEYGDVYRENKDAMAEVVSQLPPNIQQNPSKEDLEDLMWSVIRRSGNFKKYAAMYHAQSVQEKKDNSTSQPPTTSGSETAPIPKTIAESFQLAKKTLGLGGEIRL
jgi:hypothetical protein